MEASQNGDIRMENLKRNIDYYCRQKKVMGRD